MTRPPEKFHRQTAKKRPRTRTGLALILGGCIVLAGSIERAAAKPCAKHPKKVSHDHKGKVTRAACLKQLKRDRMDWPPAPKAWEIKRRVGSYNWNKARQVAICETGMNLNHYPSGRYRGPLGMFVSTQDYGKRRTGYWNPTTWQEHVAIAVAAHPITRGWSGWGCG